MVTSFCMKERPDERVETQARPGVQWPGFLTRLAARPRLLRRELDATGLFGALSLDLPFLHGKTSYSIKVLRISP